MLLISLLLANGIGTAMHVKQAVDAHPLAREILDSPQNLLTWACAWVAAAGALVVIF